MSREQCMWIVPPVKGQVVMLNMESDQFNELKEYFGGMEGHVLDHETHVIRNWVHMSEHDKARATTLIQIGERTLTVRLFNLIPISNLFVDLHRVSFARGEVFTFTNLDMNEKLDYHLIEKGRHVRSKTHFTEQHRKEFFKLCAEHFTPDVLTNMNEYQLATYEALAQMGIDLPTSGSTSADLGTPPHPTVRHRRLDGSYTEGAETVLYGTAGTIVHDDILAFLDDTIDDEGEEHDEAYFDEEDEF